MKLRAILLELETSSALPEWLQGIETAIVGGQYVPMNRELRQRWMKWRSELQAAGKPVPTIGPSRLPGKKAVRKPQGKQAARPSWYKSPEFFYSPGSIAFIFGGSPGQFWAEPFPGNHPKMFKDHPEIVEAILGEPKQGMEPADLWDAAEKRAILGRISADGYDVSIWNADPRQTEELLPGLLNLLLRRKMIDNLTVVYAPALGRRLKVKQVAGARASALDQEQKKRLEAMKQMHLATGADKDALRQRAGLARPPMKRHPMAQALQSIGAAAPGNRWWTSSEGQERRRKSL